MIGLYLLPVLLTLVQGLPNSPTRRYSPHELCPVDRSHYLLPHEYDCTKFYYCEYGLRWDAPRDCSPGTEFSYEIQVCIHPILANCTLPGYPTEPTEAATEPSTTTLASTTTTEAPTTTTSTTTTTEAPTTTTTEAPTTTTTEAPTTTTTEAPTTTTTEAPTTTTTEAPTTTTTEAPTTTTTEAPTTTTTEAPTTTTTEAPTTTTTTTTTTEAPTTTTSTTTEANDEDLLPNGCPSDFSVHKLLPHETDCDKFYYCNFGEKVVFDCAPGTYFNSALQVCDWPENVECASSDSNENGSEDGNEDGSDIELLPNGCPSDFSVHKLLAHETDCDKFYYCNFGEKVVRDCAPGTYFNSALQVCDWPENVECANSGNGTEDGSDGDDNDNEDEDNDNNGVLDNGCPSDFSVHKLLAHETDCDKFYYCNFGEKVVRDCAPGTYFNSALQVCDWPENVECANSGNGTEDGSDGDDNDNEDEDNDNNGVLDNGCPSDFSVHKLLAHETDCDKFYYCNFGEKVVRDCAPGTYFNSALQVCDWPENVECANSGNGTEDGSDGDDNDNEDEDNDNNGVLDNGCPSDFSVHKLLAHETDCDKFYYCNFGEKVVRDCAPGTYFNSALQVCDWPENVECANSGNGTENGSDGDDNDNEDEDNDNNGVLDNGCPSDFSVHKLLAHETDCDKFYYCNFGEKVVRDCAPGTYFNSALQVCDWPENVECANSGNGSEDGNDNESEDSSNEDGNDNEDEDSDNGNDNNGVLDNGCPSDFSVHKLLAHETDCDKFYYCNFGEKVVRDCAPGTYFNSALQVCDWPENVECANNGTGSEDGNDNESEASSNEDENTDNGDENEDSDSGNGDNKCTESCNVLPWAHESACDKYYTCDGEKVTLVICSEGLHFNAKTGTCDFICNAGCVRDAIQSTADAKGVKIFVPWNKVDDSVAFRL